MQHDAWFFVGIFAFIFLIWIATGGPLRPLAYTGPTLPQPQELGGGTYLSLPRSPFGIGGGSYISLPGSSNGGGSLGTIGFGNMGGSGGYTQPLQGIPFGTPSSFRGRVTLNSYVTNASSTNPRTEYVTLSVPQGGSSVNISGWQLVSEITGKAARIPKGVPVPTTGIINQTQDIVLMPGERAYVISGLSPIGVSFRENKCTGYLSTFQSYTPALPQSCPSPAAELPKYYGGDFYARDTVCRDYVNTIGSCQATPFPARSYQGERISEECRDFITTYVTYNGCVRTHRDDPDFHGSTWRVYLGQTKHLWRWNNEIVKLLDRNLHTVEAFVY